MDVRPFVTSGILFMSMLAAGCAGRITLDEGLGTAKEEGKVVAILRDDLPMERSRGLLTRPHKKYFISVASIDKGEQPKPIDFTSLKDPTNKKGWRYLALSPGTYFLDLQYDRDQHSSYWFHLAKDVPATYIGTITYDCSDIDSLDCLKIVDEHDRLQNDPAHRGFGGATTSLLRRYPPSSPALSRSDPVGLAVGPGPTVRTPDWRQRAMRRAVLSGGGEDEEHPVLNAVGFDIELLTGGGNILVVFLSAPVGALHLAYLPVGYTIGKIAGSSAERKWRPCMEAFAQRTQRLDVPGTFRGAAKRWTERYGGAKLVLVGGGEANNVPGVLLDFDSLRVGLRECGPGDTYCIELTCLVKVIEKNAVTQSRAYVYSDASRKTSRGYEILLGHQSTGHEMRDYCGSAEGMDKLIVEVEEGIQAVTEAAFRDVFGQPGPPVEEKTVPVAR